MLDTVAKSRRLADPPGLEADQGAVESLLRTIAIVAGASGAALVGSDGQCVHRWHAALPVRDATPGSWVDGAASGSPVHRMPLPPRSGRRLTLALTGVTAANAVASHHVVEALLDTLASAVAERADLRQAERKAAALAHAAGSVAVGLILLDPAHLIMFANREAERLLDGHDGLHRQSGRVAVTSLREAFKLRDALRKVSLGTRRDGCASAVLSIARAGRSPLILTILPGCDAQSGIDVVENGLLLWLVDPETGVGEAVQPICELHGLSRMEGMLAAALFRGQSLDEAAADHQLKISTCRSYLRNVFSKMDCSSQAELVSKLARYAHRIVARESEVSASAVHNDAHRTLFHCEIVTPLRHHLR